MEIEEAYETLKARKQAAGFDEQAAAQVVHKDVMRRVCVGLDIDTDDLSQFAARYSHGLVNSREVAVTPTGMLVVPPEMMIAVVVDMVLLGSFHHEQTRREIDSGDGS